MDEVSRSAALSRDPLMLRLRAEFRTRQAAERSADRAAEIRRLVPLVEAQRAVRLAPGHDPEHPKRCAGPVSLFGPEDPRRTDCLVHWDEPGRCRCGCGAPLAPAQLRRSVGLPHQDDLFAGLVGADLERGWW